MTEYNNPAPETREFDPPLVECILCGSGHLRPFDRDFMGVAIVACHGCGLRFMNPQYSDADLARYYGSGGYVEHISSATDVEAEERGGKQDNLDIVRRFVDSGRFLGVGCGNGTELWLARDMGYQTEGLDVDPQVAQRISQSLDIPCHCGDLLTQDLPEGGYSVVYLDQVLEHLKNPSAILARIDRLLAPGGVLYLGLPNVGGWSNRYKTLIGRLGLKRRRGRHYDTYHHIAYFRPKVVADWLEQELGYRTELLEGAPPHDAHPILGSLERRLRSGSTFRGVFRKPRGQPSQSE